jgi:hypothetical protein
MPDDWISSGKSSCGLSTRTPAEGDQLSPWRQLLPVLDGLPLLPCGAGDEGKAPTTPTGAPMKGWETAAFTPQQIDAMNGVVRSVGTRTGPDAGGLLILDVDGITAVQWLAERGCHVADAETWQIHRNTDPHRLKVCWAVPEELWHQLYFAKVNTRDAVKDDAGKVIEKGENLALYFGTGQCLVLGEHPSSGGHYYWPDGCHPPDLAEIPPEWWGAVLELLDHGEAPGQPGGRRAPADRGDWQRLKPCPVCGRNERPVCSVHRDGRTLRCFHGSTFSPPTMVKGQKVQGTRWAFSKVQNTTVGTFSSFALAEDNAKPNPAQVGLHRGAQDRQREPSAPAGAGAAQDAAGGPEWPAWVGVPKRLSHSRRLDCLERCIQHEAKRQRNSLRRRARLLRFARALDLAKDMGPKEISQRVLEAKDAQHGHHFEALTAADRAVMERPTVEWTIPDLIPARDLTIIGGRAKVGKTRLAVAIAAALLKGTSFLGYAAPAEPSPVILISDDQADGDTADMLERLELWQHPLLVWSRHFRLTEDNLDRLLAAIDAHPGAVVILDSLRSIGRALPHGENDPEIGATLYDLKQAVIDRGGTPLLIHHCNKSESLTGTEALSGHNAIAGAANTVFTLHYLQGENGLLKEDPQRRLVREGRSGPPFDLVIAPANLGASYRKVSTYGDWRQQVEDARKVKGMTEHQQQALEVLASDPDRWWTVREVVEAMGLLWEGSKSGDGQNVKRCLDRLAQLGQADPTRAGNAKTYRVALTRTPLTNPTDRLQENGSDGVTPGDEPDGPTKLDGLSPSGSSLGVTGAEPLHRSGSVGFVTSVTPGRGVCVRGENGWSLAGPMPKGSGKTTKVLVRDPQGVSHLVERQDITPSQEAAA